MNSGIKFDDKKGENKKVILLVKILKHLNF